MSSTAPTPTTTTHFINSLPSTIGPYLRRISESGPFKHTAQAVRFVRRFLTNQKPEQTTTYPLTLTFRAPYEDDSERRRIRKASRSVGTTSGSVAKIFSHGSPVPCPVNAHDANSGRMKKSKSQNTATKTLAGARDKLNSAKKTRSSMSKRVTKAQKGAKKKATNPFAQTPSMITSSMEIENAAMDVDVVECRPISLSASCPRPLTRTESSLSYSVKTGIVVTHSKRKMQRSSSEHIEARLKRLRLSVSMTSSSTPHLPSITPEAVLEWISSQASVHHLIAENLKSFFVPPSLSEKLHDKRMRKLTPIVNEMASVIPSPYSRDGSQHWVVLKDNFHAQMMPHLRYESTVAHIRLNRATKGSTRRPELPQAFGRATRTRRPSPLVNEL